MKISTSAIVRAVESLLDTEARKSTVYVSPTLVVSACRRHQIDRRHKTTEIVVKLGKPNYAEREFIRLCLKAKEPFSVKKAQLKWYGATK